MIEMDPKTKDRGAIFEMEPKTKGLLIFALGGVIIAGIIMGLFNLPNVTDLHGAQSMSRLCGLMGTFVGFLCIGYGFTLLRQTKN
jgi:hypothetical protein